MLSGMNASIRAARAGDAPAIAEIYNEGIEDRQATFDTDPRRPADFAAALGKPGGLPFLVADHDGEVVGFARVLSYSPRQCYAGVGEASMYIARSSRGAGLGPRLLAALAEEAARRGHWKLIGLVFPENEPSVRMLRSSGWREVGTFHRHGRLDGEWRDVLLVELLLGEARG
jgi:L-amino acid N-acyltransferase YncA